MMNRKLMKKNTWNKGWCPAGKPRSPAGKRKKVQWEEWKGREVDLSRLADQLEEIETRPWGQEEIKGVAHWEKLKKLFVRDSRVTKTALGAGRQEEKTHQRCRGSGNSVWRT